MKLKDLQVGDWFSIDNISAMYIVEITEIISIVSEYVPNLEFTMWEETEVTLVGKSRPNLWYKIFGWTNLIHPFKMIPLKEWQLNAVDNWKKGNN